MKRRKMGVRDKTFQVICAIPLPLPLLGRIKIFYKTVAGRNPKVKTFQFKTAVSSSTLSMRNNFRTPEVHQPF